MIKISILNINDDFSDLVILSREFFKEYESHHKDFFKIDELKDEDIVSYFSSFCLQQARKAYIAIEDEHIVGYITVYVKEQAGYWQVKKVGEISGLMIQKEHRRRGVAKRLLGSANDFFKSVGVTYYTAYTAVENHAAINFYKRNGMIPLYTTMIGEV